MLTSYGETRAEYTGRFSLGPREVEAKTGFAVVGKQVGRRLK